VLVSSPIGGRDYPKSPTIGVLSLTGSLSR
jgi:hypothetical protein